MSLQSRAREPGIHDCVTHPSDWVVACGLGDPMAAWRGTYVTDAEAEDIIARAGGLVPLFDEGYASIGVPRRDGDPVEGDIGVLRVAGEEAGSIFTGRRWTFIGKRGIGFATVLPEAVAAVWAVGRP
ncbi:hypothetical protein [Novosphingobium sp. PhB165]|uniref:DUF6950 family protein n=1 Tax=Novosphingobium sp. PhB165 TaxID=2485105 RepID=UPI00104315A4|nr:hypothetical protein [Novosphingobium sp. PhB165]